MSSYIQLLLISLCVLCVCVCAWNICAFLLISNMDGHPFKNSVIRCMYRVCMYKMYNTITHICSVWREVGNLNGLFGMPWRILFCYNSQSVFGFFLFDSIYNYILYILSTIYIACNIGTNTIILLFNKILGLSQVQFKYLIEFDATYSYFL